MVGPKPFACVIDGTRGDSGPFFALSTSAIVRGQSAWSSMISGTVRCGGGCSAVGLVYELRKDQALAGEPWQRYCVDSPLVRFCRLLCQILLVKYGERPI